MQHFLIKYVPCKLSSAKFKTDTPGVELLSCDPPPGGGEMTARRSRGGPQSLKYLVSGENGSRDEAF